MTAILAGTVETREVTRLLKFPSGELPMELSSDVSFGSRFDGSGFSSAIIDELFFRRSVDDEIYSIGDGNVYENQDADTTYPSVDESSTEIFIHMLPTSSNTDGLPISGLPEDGGALRIMDEIIFYESLDTATGELTGVRRGQLKTEESVHSFGEPVEPIEGFHVALLDGTLTRTGHEVRLNKVANFPRDGGYVIIDDEIIGYTRIDGNTLVMPVEAEGDESSLTGDLDVGGGIFRGRFGTVATEHEPNSIVLFFPARYEDRYRERSADADTSGVTLRKRVDGAIWKRVSWDERPVTNMDVKLLVRFDGTPDWDSDNIFSVSEGYVVSGDAESFDRDPKSFLYMVDNPHDANRLNIQADFVEVRFLFQYREGAYNIMDDAPMDSWKDTPWIKALRLEYVAPDTVHYTEELR
jgi:hypothetical protein